LKLFKNNKWLVLILAILSAPFAYGYFMAYWSAWISLPLTLHFADGVTGHMASALLTMANAVGIIVIGLLLSVPLNTLFSDKGYLAALAMSLAIVSWSLVTLIQYSAMITNILTIIEWLMVLIILPFIVASTQKYASHAKQTKCA